MVSKLLLFAFLVVFMAGWSYLLCKFDDECQPFAGDFIFFPNEDSVIGADGDIVSRSSLNNSSSSSNSSVNDQAVETVA